MDFLVVSDLTCMIVIRKGSSVFGTFGLGKKSHQHAVQCLIASCDWKAKVDPNFLYFSERQGMHVHPWHTHFFRPYCHDKPKAALDFVNANYMTM